MFLPTQTPQQRLDSDCLKDVLSLAVRGAGFDALLGSLLRAAQGLAGAQPRASVYLAEPEHGRLRMLASHGLDPTFATALATLPIGPGEASCGRAAHLRETVIVPDVFEEPRLAPYLDLARAHAIRACWSFPLHAPDGRVVGTLAFYPREPGAPDAALTREFEYFADLAALLIERQLSEQDNARRHAESQRRLAALADESERLRRLYETVLDNTPDLVYVFDLEHRFTYANRVLLQMWGRTWDEAIGKTCLELGYPDWHAARQDREIEEVKATCRPIRGEVPFDGAFGLRIYDYIFVPVIGPDGAVEAIAGTTRDVTERKQYEQALGESEQRFRTITNAMPQMVWTARPDGHIDYHNEQFYRFAGLAPGDAQGDDWAEHALHPDDRAAGMAAWRRSVATGEPYEATYRLRHHSGEYRWILARGLPLRDAGGRIVEWLGTDTDIHRQKLAEDARAAANQRKDEFLAMLAHELRNPLAPISAAAQVLRVAGTDPERVRNYAEVIGRQVNHMTALVNDLLDVSRVTRGMVQFEHAPVDVKAVVTSAAEQVHPLVEANRHTLALALDSAPAWTLGDRARLVQVLANLLANAAKYTPPGGRIVLALERRAERLAIRVADNGSGIDAALLPHVFDLFTQGRRTPDRAQGGLGLGLALARTIVAAHDGTIHAASAGPGQGSTFTVELPAAPPPATAPAPAAAPRAHAAPLRILLVDDNPDAAATLTALLTALGHTVDTRNDPVEAIGHARAAPPDAFILDIGMPGMDGHDLARRLRATPGCEHALYVALTGYGQAHDRARSREAGFDLHLVKPVDMNLLLDALAQARRAA